MLSHTPAQCGSDGLRACHFRCIQHVRVRIIGARHANIAPSSLVAAGSVGVHLRLLWQIFFCTKPMFSVGRRGATACHIPLAARPHFSVARRRFLGVKTCPYFGFKNAPEKRSPNNILIFVDRFSGIKTCPDSGLKNVPDFWSRAPTFFQNLAKFLGAIHALVRGVRSCFGATPWRCIGGKIKPCL